MYHHCARILALGLLLALAGPAGAAGFLSQGDVHLEGGIVLEQVHYEVDREAYVVEVRGDGYAHEFSFAQIVAIVEGGVDMTGERLGWPTQLPAAVADSLGIEAHESEPAHPVPPFQVAALASRVITAGDYFRGLEGGFASRLVVGWSPVAEFGLQARFDLGGLDPDPGPRFYQSGLAPGEYLTVEEVDAWRYAVELVLRRPLLGRTAWISGSIGLGELRFPSRLRRHAAEGDPRELVEMEPREGFYTLGLGLVYLLRDSAWLHVGVGYDRLILEARSSSEDQPPIPPTAILFDFHAGASWHF